MRCTECQRDTGGFGHRPAGPVRCLVRRFGAGQRHDARHRLGGDRRLAGLAGLVAQQPIRACFSEALLPAPHHRAADAQPRRALAAPARAPPSEHDPCALDMLLRPVAVRSDRLKRSVCPTRSRSRIPSVPCEQTRMLHACCESTECVRALACPCKRPGLTGSQGPDKLSGPLVSARGLLCSVNSGGAILQCG